MTNKKHLKCEVINQWSGINHSSPIIQSLQDIVSWKVNPPFSRGGRSAWLALKDPITVTTPHREIVIEQLKIKGVGLCNFERNVSPPSTKTFTRVRLHLGFTRKGRIKLFPGSSEPIGGMLISRTRTEYAVSSKLIEEGIPSEVPIAAYQYKEPDFHFKISDDSYSSMGVMIAGLPQNGYDRSDRVLKYGENKEMTKKYDEFARNIAFKPNTEDPGLSLFAEMYARYGRHIRRFSHIGLYRHSADPTNLGFSSSLKDIYFTDLDSCRSLSECSEIDTPLQVIRDAMSALFQIMGALTEPDKIQDFHPQRVSKIEIFKKYLRGYYPDVSNDSIDMCGNIMNEYYEVFHSTEMQHFNQTKNSSNINEDASYQEVYDELWKRSETNYPELFSWTFAIALRLHTESEMGALYPLKIKSEQLFADLAELTSVQNVRNILNKLDISHIQI